MASIDATTAERRSLVIHPAWVRVTHWINAIAMLVMIGSGWEIYNASPLFGFTLSADRSRSAAGSPARCSGTSRRCGCWRSTAWSMSRWALVTGRFRRKLLPIRPARGRGATSRPRCAFKLAHDDLSKYNAVQRLLYAGIIVVGDRDRAVGPGDLEAGAVPMADRAVRRLRRRALCAFLLPWPRSSAFSSCMCCWRCSCRRACAP